MFRCLEDKEAAQFLKLKSVDDFIDGFELKTTPDVSAQQLQRLLKEAGLDAKYPMARQQAGSYWLQLASAPFDVASVMPNLKIAADTLEGLRSGNQAGHTSPIVTKVDVTRDLRGSLFAKEDWKNKHQLLAGALEEKFCVPFRDNSNSFNSCFQFEGQDQTSPFKIRVKFYFKSLEMF